MLAGFDMETEVVGSAGVSGLQPAGGCDQIAEGLPLRPLPAREDRVPPRGIDDQPRCERMIAFHCAKREVPAMFGANHIRELGLSEDDRTRAPRLLEQGAVEVPAREIEPEPVGLAESRV